MISMILLCLGLTFLGKRAIQYRRAAYAEKAALARCLAESGLDDAFTKFRRDIEFPPLSRDQKTFSYSEEMTVDGEPIGSYRVTLDGSRRLRPHCIWVITVQGVAGADPFKPDATRILRAEIDVEKHGRSDTSVHDYAEEPTNTNFYHIINFEDLGGL